MAFQVSKYSIFILKCIYMLLLKFIRNINLDLFSLCRSFHIYIFNLMLIFIYDDYLRIAFNSFIPNLRACPYTKLPEF